MQENCEDCGHINREIGVFAAFLFYEACDRAEECLRAGQAFGEMVLSDEEIAGAGAPDGRSQLLDAVLTE